MKQLDPSSSSNKDWESQGGRGVYFLAGKGKGSTGQEWGHCQSYVRGPELEQQVVCKAEVSWITKSREAAVCKGLWPKGWPAFLLSARLLPHSPACSMAARAAPTGLQGACAFVQLAERR